MYIYTLEKFFKVFFSFIKGEMTIKRWQEKERERDQKWEMTYDRRSDRTWIWNDLTTFVSVYKPIGKRTKEINNEIVQHGQSLSEFWRYASSYLNDVYSKKQQSEKVQCKKPANILINNSNMSFEYWTKEEMLV